MYFGFVAPLNVTQPMTDIKDTSPHTAAFLHRVVYESFYIGSHPCGQSLAPAGEIHVSARADEPRAYLRDMPVWRGEMGISEAFGNLREESIFSQQASCQKSVVQAQRV